MLEIALFHLNHGLRGEEAERDEKFCRDFAQARKLPIFVERRDVRVLQREEKLSLEEAARKARYLALREGAQRWGASRVALGHTLDDQVETVLMNLIRGTGLRGLSGMRMHSDIFIRPPPDFFKTGNSGIFAGKRGSRLWKTVRIGIFLSFVTEFVSP